MFSQSPSGRHPQASAPPPDDTPSCDRVTDDNDTAHVDSRSLRRGPGPRFNLRTIKQGLYHNPIGLCTGLVNKMNELMEDKVHFAPTPSAEDKKPAIHFDPPEIESCSSESSEDYQV